MKPFLPYLMILAVMTCCHSNRDDRTFDTNPAEAVDDPGERDRKNSETNEEAARRGGKTEPNDPADKTHPALTELGEATDQQPSFVTKAADAGHAEVMLAELAVKKTKNKEIKQFAEMMLKDHSAANEELKKLADKKGIKIPAECSTCDAAYKQLHDLGTEEFNQRYAEMMVTDHERAVKLFSDEAESGKDAEMKNWAKEKLPALQHHLAMAKDLDDNKR